MILRADAFALPFGDASFDVVVADPPLDFEAINRVARSAPNEYGGQEEGARGL